MKYKWVKTYCAGIDDWEPAGFLDRGGVMLLGSDDIYDPNEEGNYFLKNSIMPWTIGEEIKL